MQKAVLFRERRSADTFPDCGGNTLIAEPQFAGRVQPRAGSVPRPNRAWMQQIACIFARGRKGGARPSPVTQGVAQLSKGWAKSMYLADGARVACRSGKVWITLDEGGEDIVLTAGESKSFASGTRVLVEALAASRISLESL